MHPSLKGSKLEQNISRPANVKVLLYHRIVEDQKESNAFWPCVHITQFKKQLEFLDRWGFTTITLRDYRLSCEGRLNLPAKPVIITFDDGYQDTYTMAFPALQEYGMKAVVFVLGDRRIKTNYWDRQQGFPEAPLMDGNQIVEMHESGTEIGAHSMTHVDLTSLPEEETWDEISRSRMLLEILLNKPVQSFAYPFGRLDGATKRMVQNAGYLNACSVSSGPVVFGKDQLEMRRLTIFNTTGSAGFALRMLTPYEYYSWLHSIGGRLFKKMDRHERLAQRLLEEKKRAQETKAANSLRVHEDVYNH